MSEARVSTFSSVEAPSETLGIWERRSHPARVRSDLPGIPSLSMAAARLIDDLGFTQAEMIKHLNRSPDAPCFQADLDSLSDNRIGGAAVVFNPLDLDRILLQVWRQTMWYTETGGGEAILTLLRHSLPESICSSVARSEMGIADLIEDSSDPFYLCGNSTIVSVSNQPLAHLPTLTIVMRPVFSVKHWRA